MSEEATLDEFVQGEDSDGNVEQARGWVRSSIAQISRWTDAGGTPRTSNEDYWEGDIPWVQTGELTKRHIRETEKQITELGLEESTAKRFPPGTLLIGMYGEPTVGESALLEIEATTNQACCGVFPDTDTVNAEFLHQMMQYEKPRLYSLRAGSGQQNIRQGIIRKFEINVPPLPEQRKIATVLYTVDRAIEKTSELIEQLGRVKQGVRQNILTSGITEEGKVRASPESEPEQYTDARQWTVPNSWDLKELSDICSVQVGYAFKSDWYQEEGNIRVLRGANVGYGEPDWSDTYFLEPERVSEYEEYLLNEGDLIIGMDRPYTNSGFKISRLSKADVPSLLVQRVGRFVSEGCDPDYLHVVLSDWRYQKQVLRGAQGMDIPHISQSDILSPKIPLPPLDEQKRIAGRYSSILNRIDCEENLLREYKTLKQGLMQDLLSGTVRTTDTNIEVPDEIAQYG